MVISRAYGRRPEKRFDEQYPVVVAGAGVTGLAAARLLQSLGVECVVFEKGARVGGRCATRTAGDAVFDYGAQFFTARSAEFQQLVGEWTARGVVREWTRSFPSLDGVAEQPGFPRHIGAEGMSGVAEALAEGVEVRFERRIKRVTEARGYWDMEMEEGPAVRADALLLTMPLPLALRLINDENTWRLGALLAPVAGVRYFPCFAAMAVLEGPSGLPAPGALRMDEGPAAWVADNRIKGVSKAHAVTIHATHDWSEDHLDLSPQEAAQALLEAVQPHLASRAAQVQGYRWRHSAPAAVLPTMHYCLDCRAPLCFAGDAFGGRRIEGAVLSGRSAARALAARLSGEGDTP